MKTGNNSDHGNLVVPTSTAAQTRMMIYQPSQRPRYRKGEWMMTSYGRSRVDGRLGQRHEDLMDIMMFRAERRRDIEDGGVELLVDPAVVRRDMSANGNQYSYQQIEKLIKELRAATITMEINGIDFPIIGGLLDHVLPSPMTRRDPLTGGERNMWRVRLGVAFVRLLDHDLNLYYEPVPVARLQHGVSQAIARHVLSHKTVPKNGWHLDTLLHAVCGESAKSMTIRNGRRRVKDDAVLLQAMGIEVTQENRVKRATNARCDPAPVPQTPEGVPQTPDCVSQTPDCVPQTPDN